MTAKILDNIVLASWTSVCKSVAINAETMDTEDELEMKTEDPQQKAGEGVERDEAKAERMDTEGEDEPEKSREDPQEKGGEGGEEDEARAHLKEDESLPVGNKEEQNEEVKSKDEEGLDKPKYEEEQIEVENPKDGEKLQEDE